MRLSADPRHVSPVAFAEQLPWLVAGLAGGAIAGRGAAAVVRAVTAVSQRQALVPGELLGRLGRAYRAVSNGGRAVGAAVGLGAPFRAGAAVLLLPAADGRRSAFAAISPAHDNACMIPIGNDDVTSPSTR